MHCGRTPVLTNRTQVACGLSQFEKQRLGYPKVPPVRQFLGKRRTARCLHAIGGWLYEAWLGLGCPWKGDKKGKERFFRGKGITLTHLLS